MKKFLAGTFIVVGLLAATGAQAEPKTVTLKIDNMHCPACPLMIERQLSRVDGVDTVDVSWPDRTAKVTYESTKVTTDRLSAKLAEAGYLARIYGGPE